MLEPAVGTPGKVQELARADALDGRASRALYDALCMSDPAWVDAHVDVLVKAAPERTADLETSFKMAPTAWYKKLRGRATAAGTSLHYSSRR